MYDGLQLRSCLYLQGAGRTARHTYRDFKIVTRISLLESGGSIRSTSYYDDVEKRPLGAHSASFAERSKSFAARENHLQQW